MKIVNSESGSIKGLKILILLFTLYSSPVTVLFAELSAGDYQITRVQTGGIGSGFCEKGNIRLYHSFSQSSPVGSYTSNDVSVFSGYLVIGGSPLQITAVTPAFNQLGVAISTFAKVYFDGEINPGSVPDSFNMLAVRDKDGRTIYRAVPADIRHFPEDNSVKITPKNPLLNNYQYRIEISTSLTETTECLPLETTVQWEFDTIINPSESNIVGSDYNKDLKAEIPAGAFPDYYYVEISSDPLTSPIKTLPEHILEANAKAISNGVARRILGYYEFVTMDNKDEAITIQSAKQVAISLPFSRNKTFSPGLQSQNAFLRLEKNINLYRLNEEKKLWVRMPDVSVDNEKSLISGTIPRFGTFAMFVDPNYYLGDAYAYPVPFSPNENPNHRTITFTNLATKCTIKIFTVSGELVNEFEETDGDGEYVWSNVKNKDGKSLASGVYLYLIESKQDKKVGKLMIIK